MAGGSEPRHARNEAGARCFRDSKAVGQKFATSIEKLHCSDLALLEILELLLSLLVAVFSVGRSGADHIQVAQVDFLRSDA